MVLPSYRKLPRLTRFILSKKLVLNDLVQQLMVTPLWTCLTRAFRQFLWRHSPSSSYLDFYGHKGLLTIQLWTTFRRVFQVQNSPVANSLLFLFVTNFLWQTRFLFIFVTNSFFWHTLFPGKLVRIDRIKCKVQSFRCSSFKMDLNNRPLGDQMILWKN
jgi:hypothetical protein